MFALSERLGVDKLRLELYIPMGQGTRMQSEYTLTEKQLLFTMKMIEYLRTLGSNVELISPFDVYLNKSGCAQGCGAGTTTMVINSDLSISACDMLTESDATDVKINKPSEIKKIWLEHKIFEKWRHPEHNLACSNKANSLCQTGCALANQVYPLMKIRDQAS